MARRSRRSRTRVTWKTALYGGFAVCFAGVMGYAAVKVTGQPQPDEVGCYTVGDQPQTYVFAETSEPRWDAVQARALRVALDQEYKRLSFNEKLSIFTSDSTEISSVPEARFHVCGTARNGDALKKIGAAGADTGYLQREKERLYEESVVPEFDDLLTLNPADDRRQKFESPILEMVQSLSRLPDFENATHRRLILISDLIQNSETSRFCQIRGDLPRFSQFKAREQFDKVAPASLQGVDVELLMLQRFGLGTPDMPYCTENELRNFWVDYFKDAGAARVEITMIRAGVGEVQK